MKNSKFFCSLLSTLLFQFMAAAAPQPQVAEFHERVISLNQFESFYTISHIVDESQPTLIFLPGIFRGFLQDEEFLSLLNKRPLNWVAWHTSRHPESVLRGVNPWSRSITTQNLAEELLALKQAFHLKKPLVVSLSYSASLVPLLNRRSFPVVIETAPMGRADENSPPSTYYDSWKRWMDLWPVVGTFIVQSQEYWAYRGFWMQQTTDLAKTHEVYKGHERAIAEGLAQLAYASRDFDLRRQNFTQGPIRYWILGEKENRRRKNLQLQAVQLYEQQTGRKNSAFEIRNAAHVIPNENPQAFAKLLSHLVEKLSQQLQ